MVRAFRTILSSLSGGDDMDDLMRFFEEVLKFFKMPMTVYGFTFSFWDIALWGCVAYIAIRIIRGLLDG